MNTKHLTAHFKRVCDAPGALPRLRRLIVELSVAGKLATQDLENERVEDPYLEEPVSDALPPNWRLLKCGRYCNFEGGNQPPKSQFFDEPRPGYVRLYQIRDLGDRPVPTYIPQDSTNRFSRVGEILIGRYGASVGKIFWAEDGAYNVALTKFVYPNDAFRAQFAFLLLKSSVFQHSIERATRSAQAGFNKGDLKEIEFPLPPLAEQERIVRKVDELMALCDDLERAQMKRERKRDRLTISSQRRMIEATTDPKLFRVAAGFYLERLPRLATRPEHISELRRTILDLAVRGILVASEADDEPVGKLMGRLKADVDRRKAAGEYSDPQRFVDIQKESLPFSIPSRWDWVRLVEIAQVSYGFAFPSSQFNSDKRGMPLIRIRDISKDDTEAYFEGDYDDFHVVHKGDYLVGMDGDFSVRRWKGPDALLNQRVMRIRNWATDLTPRFFAIPLQTILDYLHSATSLTTVKHLSAKQVNGIYLPLPPIGEQQRIVAMVDELMAGCDELEEQLVDGSSKRSRLLEAFLHEALNSAA